MKTTFLLFASALATVTLLQVAPSQAAPRRPVNTYDQRQDGKLNVHAKLENFLVVVAPSSAGSADLAGLLQNDLVIQALELKNVASRVANHAEDAEISAGPVDSADTGAETSARISGQEVEVEKPKQQPEASVKLVAIIQRDLPESVESSQSTQTSLKPKDDLKKDVKIEAEAEAVEASEKSKKTARSLAAVAGDSSVSKLPPRAIGQQDDRLENKVTGQNGPGNYVGPAEGEPQELKLIGDGIENCGPDRYRDRIDGICKARVDA